MASQTHLNDIKHLPPKSVHKQPKLLSNKLAERLPGRYRTIISEDIETGKNKSLKEFQDLTKESLEEHIDWYIGDEKRETYLMILVSEILHHEGQIAAIIGLKDRIDGSPPKPIPPEA